MSLQQKRALITGITGQDGSFLAEYLLGHGVEVWGLHRRTSTPNFSNIQHLGNNFNLMNDLTDLSSLIIIHRVNDCIYNLASQFLFHILDTAHFTAQTTELVHLHSLAARIVNPKIKSPSLLIRDVRDICNTDTG